MQYNTQQKRMPLPEYGRSIQNMVDHALTIEDRAERQRCANTIINIMGNMFPHLRDVPDFKHKLWDHLAIMANFQLDIDYPYEIIRKDNLNTKPESIPYPSTKTPLPPLRPYAGSTDKESYRIPGRRRETELDSPHLQSHEERLHGME